MKNGGKMLICAAGCLALGMAARAAKLSAPGDAAATDKPADTLSPDNPYGAIVERNVFDLHDPPPPKLEPDKPKDPPANIKLTGITTIFGHKQALFSVNKPGAAGKPPTLVYLTLTEGQRKDDVEVLEINPKARSAKITSDGMESVLNIETNHAGAAGGPPPTGGHAPGTAPGFQPQNPYGGNKMAIPPRSPRTDYQPTPTPAPPAAYNPGQYNPGAASGAINPYGGAAVPQTVASQQPQLSPLEQYTLMEAQRLQNQQPGGDPNIPMIMPPTPLSQGQNPESSQENTTSSGPPTPGNVPLPGQRTSGTLSGGGGIYVPGR